MTSRRSPQGLAMKNIVFLIATLPLLVDASFVSNALTRSRRRQPFVASGGVSNPASLAFSPHQSTTSSRRAAADTSASLIPEENPQADLTQRSLSGVLYSSVVDGIHQLYLPADLGKRNAASRTDGYWPFVQKGEDPPPQLTYGEFDLPFFAQLLDTAHSYYVNSEQESDDATVDWSDKVFCDIGSGTGRLVLAAAALHPSFRSCRGIELLHSIHVVAEESLEKCHVDHEKRLKQRVAEEAAASPATSSSLVGEQDWMNQFQGQYMLTEFDADFDADEDDEEDQSMDNTTDEEEAVDDTDGSLSSAAEPSYCLSIPPGVDDNHDPFEDSQRLAIAPVELKCGSFDAVYFGDADVIFCFSSCMSSSIIQGLSKAIGRQCKPGTIVITTEFPLQLEGTIDPLDDPEESTYVHCNYDGNFDDADDATEWARFCDEEGIESQIPFQFDLLESVDGYCWLTGGLSTAHVHRVVTSAWTEEGAAEAADASSNEMSKEENAAMAWIYAQKQYTGDFYRDVRNNMVFHGFSEAWYKDLVDEQ
jgi:hypothetical protein